MSHQPERSRRLLFFARVIRPVTNLERELPAISLAFIILEVLAIVAVPILGYVGIQTLLDSRAGTFLSEPGPEDPGYRALVDASPVVAVVEMDDGEISGIVIVARPGEAEAGGAIVVVPGELEVAGTELSEREPAAAVEALASALKLRIPSHLEVDAAMWADTLGGETVEIQNPDPLVGAAGEEFDVGDLELDDASIGQYLAASRRLNAIDDAGQDDPRFSLFRRSLVWLALLESPPAGEGPLAELLAVVGSEAFRVELLPIDDDPVEVDDDESEALIREVVPFPAGSTVGDRLRVRVLGAPQAVDVYLASTVVAQLGVEVVELGNVALASGSGVDGSPAAADRSVLIVPPGLDDPRIDELADAIGADTLVGDESDDNVDGIITLILGGELEGP